jgi:hypothetical protein
MVFSYFADIVRLKDFHPNIHKTRRVTNFAYSFFWFLRCGPIQLVGELPRENHRIAFINESLVATVWISEFVEPLGIDKNIFERYLKELVYFFRYRNYNAQSLELMLTSLHLGAGQNPFKDE